MSLSIQELETHLRTAVSIFQNDSSVRDLPFMWQFPINCCERAAALLCVALKKKYPDSQVLYVSGKKLESADMHFWLEFDGIVLDPTAHQFEDSANPLICFKPSPLESTFLRCGQTEDPVKETDLETNSNGKWHAALAILCRAIEA